MCVHRQQSNPSNVIIIVYFLDYVEDIYIRVFSVLVSILNPNHFVFITSNK